MNISNIADVPLHISPGNTKLGRIPNISLIPVIDCGNHLHCMNKCYAKKAYRMYRRTRFASGNNSYAFRNEPEIAFDILNKWFLQTKPEFFRIHVAGDVLNQEYLNSWIRLCKNHPYTKYLTMTKMFDFNYQKVPDNMIVRFSVWSSMTDIPEIKEGISGYVWINDHIETRIPEHAFKCTGSCSDCLHCWNHRDDIVINLH